MITLLHSFQVGEHRSSGSSLSAKQILATERPQQDTGDKSSHVDGCRKLGDFSAVWEYLAKTPSQRQDSLPTKGAARLEHPADILPKDKDERPVTISGEIKGLCSSQGKIALLQRPQKPKEEVKSAERASVPATPCGTKAKASPSKRHGGLLAMQQSSDEDTTDATPTGSRNVLFTPKARLRVEPVLAGTAEEKKLELISKLRKCCPNDHKCLTNAKLSNPAFALSNTSNNGIHVFVDMSNVSPTAWLDSLSGCVLTVEIIDYGWVPRHYQERSRHPPYHSGSPPSVIVSQLYAHFRKRPSCQQTSACRL